MEHHLPSTPGNVHWGLWDAVLPPVLRIASGDRVTIETLSGEPEDLPEPASGFEVLPDHRQVLATAFRGPGPHLLTGPIYVEGDEPGDVLEVRLLDIKFRTDWGWNLQLPFWLFDFEEAVGKDFMSNFPKPLWGRNARPDEQAWPLLFLNSPRSSYVTGVQLEADAGFKAGMFTGQIDPSTLIPEGMG